MRIHSDLKVTNFPALREACIERLWNEPHAVWTPDELEAIGDLLAAYAGKQARERRYHNNDWRENPGLVVLVRDLDELRVALPKWVALTGWLTPESTAGSAPELIAQVARLALEGRLGEAQKQG